jgi:MHS family alpha-ketoglutarate permease-like MFS transporter
MEKGLSAPSDQNSGGMSSWTRLKNIVGGSAGNLVEWFDWFSYAAFSVYFASVFFPKGDQTTQFLQSAVVFGVGFIARPAGAWLMGMYSDRAGRKAGLILSVNMMCLGSLIIAFTPGFATIGIFAPLLLTVARIIQGLSLGGEYGASATYVSEMAGKDRRGFWSGFLYITLIGGQLLAVSLLFLLQNILSPEDLQAWGWRIPFVVGALLAVVVFWLRRGIHETTSFENAKKDVTKKRGSTLELIRRHPMEFGLIMVLSGAGATGFYIYTTYMQVFLINSAAGPAGEGFSFPDHGGGAVPLHADAAPVRLVLRHLGPPGHALRLVRHRRPDRLSAAPDRAGCRQRA